MDFVEPTKSCVGMQSSMENASAHRVSCICTTKRTCIHTSKRLLLMLVVCSQAQLYMYAHAHTGPSLSPCAESLWVENGPEFYRIETMRPSRHWGPALPLLLLNQICVRLLLIWLCCTKIKDISDRRELWKEEVRPVSAASNSRTEVECWSSEPARGSRLLLGWSSNDCLVGDEPANAAEGVAWPIVACTEWISSNLQAAAQMSSREPDDASAQSNITR